LIKRSWSVQQELASIDHKVVGGAALECARTPTKSVYATCCRHSGTIPSDCCTTGTRLCEEADSLEAWYDAGRTTSVEHKYAVAVFEVMAN
jgi:hypothetical protein